MTFTRRATEFLIGLFMIIAGIILIVLPVEGYRIVVKTILVLFVARGLKLLFYYFAMARFMVGGMWILYKGIIYVDLGIFLLRLSSEPKLYVILYLVGGLGFYGILHIVRATEAKSAGNSSWKYQMILGCAVLIFAIVCLFFINDIRVLTFIFSIGIINSGISHIVNSLRNSAIIYVE